MAFIIFMTGCWLLVDGESEVFIMEVLSMYASPRREIIVPSGDVTSKHKYFAAINHRMGSNTATQIGREAQLP